MKKKLQIKDYGFNVVNEEFRECAEENLKLLNRQLKFIKYLKDEIERLEKNHIYEPLQRMAVETHKHNLAKYKEIIGGENEK